MVYTIQIIEGVRKYPVLFDPLHREYKCKRMRDEAWDRLAEELHESRNELRKKWKNIRDCYKKYIRSIAPSAPQGLRSYKNWQWAESMEFCKPFIEPELNNEENDDEFTETTNASLCGNGEETQHIPVEKPCSAPLSGNKIKNQSQPNREQGVTAVNGLDATDLIFLGYSSIVKSFAPTKQAIAKMKIAQIIMEEELQHAEGITFQSHLICKPSTSNDDKIYGIITNPITEVSVAPPPLADPLIQEQTKPRRGRKRQIRRSTDVCTSSFTTNDMANNTLELKSETKDITDSD